MPKPKTLKLEQADRKIKEMIEEREVKIEAFKKIIKAFERKNKK